MTTTTTKPKSPSRAQRNAAKAAAAAAEQPDATTEPEQPETAAAPEQPEPEPATPKPPTATAVNAAIFTALMRATGNMLDSWDDPESTVNAEARELGVTAEQARATLAHRMSYTPGADKVWDDRLGAVPTGRGKFPSTDGGQ